MTPRMRIRAAFAWMALARTTYRFGDWCLHRARSHADALDVGGN